MEEGDYVYYIPYENCPKDQYQKGRIKEVQSSEWYFVVYHCNNDWDNYKDYTGQRTNINQLVKG
jgi:hypothetical protein